MNNRDINDALEKLHSQLATNRNELDAIASQYFAKDPELIDRIEQIGTNIGNVMREIERLLPV